MKLGLKVVAGLVGLPLAAGVAFMSVYQVGYRIAVAPMDELRASLKLGMSHEDVQALMAGQIDVSASNMSASNTSAEIIQISQQSRNITSPIVGSWFCFANVRMGENGVEFIEETSCVD